MQNHLSLKDRMTAAAVNIALGYLDKDPDTNIPKLLDWADRFLPDDAYAEARAALRTVMGDPNNNWYRLVKSFYTDIDPEVRKTFFRNFIVNSALIGFPRTQAIAAQYGCNVPWAILMDPTSACNLHCVGCWAAEYGNQMNLTYEEMDSVVTQGVEMGTYVYLFTGGELMVRKNDILRLCEAHPDCVFTAFTNGTLIDEAFADEMLRVKNFIPAISIEGFEESTDSRRGNGTYQKIIRAMDILKRKKLPFGISCCYTRANAEVIGSEEYFDRMVEMGAKFAWFFTYMPVGHGAVPELMATAEQREMMYHKIREYRSTKPLFTIDFWNDGEYVGGCIAGGRRYLHINANGDVDPCVFIHYSNSNIREHTLLEALQSPIFMAYHDGQPFNDNMLRPCPMLENPEQLREIVERTGAHTTDPQSPETADHLCAKCDEYARSWKPTADRLWGCTGNCAGCSRKE